MVFILAALASSGVKRMTFTKGDGQIPPDFGTDTSQTLLVLKTSMFGDYNSRIKKVFRKSYTGKYKIIKPEELNNYPVKNYRYGFEFASVGSSIMVRSAATGMYKSGPGTIQCIITDRETGLSYPTGNTAFYGKLLKAFVPALNQQLNKKE